MQVFPTLYPGDSVEIIAPASGCSKKILDDLKHLLNSWQLNCLTEPNIFGDDLLCANSDELRFTLLKQALYNPDAKAIICVRGGYGSMRLIPKLFELVPNRTPKLFIGMSDITALNLFLQQQWHWPTLHAGLSSDKFSPRSLALVKSFVFAENPHITLSGVPMNQAAKQPRILESTLIGGNLSLIQASIGTLWQIDSANKILFLEDVNERGYRIDRMLEHLQQANVFKNASAILFGDFTKGEESSGNSLVIPVLQRFAKQCTIPVIQIHGIGHAYDNIPLPLGTKTTLKLQSDRIQLIIDR